MTKRWTLMLLVAALAAASAAAGIGVRASYGAQVTGDEPHYLLTALSLATDRSLDVSDEISERAYSEFHEVRLDPQGKPLPGGRLVSPHDPLLPALLALPLAAGGWIGAKLAVCATAGLLAASLLYLIVRRFGVPPASGAAVVAVFAASAPLAVYGNQIYPEVPAALAVVLGVIGVTGALRRPAVAATALAVIALPWLSIKFVPVACVLAGIALLRLWTRGQRGMAVVLALALATAGAVFVVTHLQWYGGVTPYASGDHFAAEGEFSVVGFDPNYAGRSRRLIGLLIDDKFGLIPWQPAWALAFPAIGAAVARLRRTGVLMAPLGAGWLTATFVALTMQGWWFPGRQIVVVLPLLVALIALWATETRGRMGWLLALGGAGILNYGWLVADGLSGRLTWVVDFFRTTSPVYAVLSRLSPNYFDVGAKTWLLQSVWLTAAIGLGWWGWRRAATDERAALPPRDKRARAALAKREIPVET